MELNELKNTWAALDNRLKENNLLNETIIKKMAESKVDKSLNRLLFWDIFSIAICTLLIPFITYWFSKYSGKILFGDIVVVYAGIVCIISVVWYITKVNYLMKINTIKNISNNIYYLNKYSIYVKRERLAMSYFIGPSMALLCILGYAEAKATLPIWILLISILVVCTVITHLSYKRLYEKNIDSIRQSLDEIKELKEE